MSDAREVPILFSGPMVRAILGGRKTETRRILKGDIPDPPAMDAIHPKHVAKHPAPYFDSYCGERKTASNPRGMSVNWCWWTRDDRQCLPTVKLRWKPGDVLWVRESFSYEYDNKGERSDIWYWADGSPADGDWTKPKPSIHMPRWASRITLEVTALRVERLQEIDEAGAIAEGMYWSETFEGYTSGAGEDESCDFHRTDPTKCFLKLWVAINGAGSWDANPWVTAITFRRIANAPVIGGAADG